LKGNTSKRVDGAKVIIRRLVPLVIVILILVVAKHLILQHYIGSCYEMTEQINAFSRQRALSQKVTNGAYEIYEYENSGIIRFYLKELKNASEDLDREFINIENTKFQKHASNNAEIDGILNELKINHISVISALYDLRLTAENDIYNRNAVMEKASVLESTGMEYIEGIDRLARVYEKYTVENIGYLARIEKAMYYSILLFILFSIVFILAPSINIISKGFNEIEESNDNLMKLFKIVHGAIFLVDLNTMQIILMNKQAEELIDAENKGEIYFNHYFWFMSHEYDVMETITGSDQYESKDMEIMLNGNKMYAAVTSAKTSFNNRQAVLIGLFDISEQKQAEQVFRSLAITDKLTGLYNRYYFEKRAADEIALSDKYNEPLSMLMLDLDHFKNVNDMYGHQMGDDVLQKTAAIIKGATRKSDYVFRVGGEEFVVLMPNTNVDSADVVAEKIRKALEKNIHPVAGKITASLGVAERNKDEHLQDWYRRVDKALYCAKEGGRNCVVNFEDNSNIASVHIEWNKEWECGNKVIDKQHMDLIEYGNTLIFMSLSGYDYDTVLKQLDNLLNHIAEHFEYEEKVLEEVGYPEREEHKKIHATLVDNAFNLRKSFIEGSINKTSFVSFLVNDVVSGHMIDEDTKFFSYTNLDSKV